MRFENKAKKWLEERKRSRRKWRDWFAWHPVYVGSIQKWVWLETVERSFYGSNSMFLSPWLYGIPNKEKDNPPS